MPDWIEVLFRLLSQFTGIQGGIDNIIVVYGIAAIFYAVLFSFAKLNYQDTASFHDRLLQWGFGFGLARELFMLVMAVILAEGLIEQSNLYQLFPPVEHVFLGLAFVTIASAYIGYLTSNNVLALRYLKAGITVTALAYLATFWWWFIYIRANPTHHFSDVWCDPLFHANGAFWLLLSAYLIYKNSRPGTTRSLVLAALCFMALSTFLKIPDIVLHEVYIAVIAPTARTLYLSAILMLGYAYISEQIQKRKFAEAQILEQASTMELLMHHSPAALAMFDRQMRYLAYSQRWIADHSLGDQDIIGRSLYDVFPGIPENWKLLHRRALEGEVLHADDEVFVRLDGVIRRVKLGIRPWSTNKQIGGIIIFSEDITEQSKLTEQLKHRALYDVLTKLPNRTLFIDRLERTISRAKRTDQHLFAVLFLDIDRFKTINDSLGHTAGDELLISIARRLETSLRPGDTVARLGGDEFTLLLENINSPEEAIRVVGRIQDTLTAPCHIQGHSLVITVSIGIAFGTTQHESATDIIRDADTAMFRAKSRGKARYEIFETSMHVHAIARLELEADLRLAIAEDQFFLHYQPIWSASSNRMIGVEALVRWQHPQRGLVSPQEFIPMSEETGLIIALGEWVMRHACLQHTAWMAAGSPPIRLAINLSVRQFQHRQFIETVESILRETGMDISLLEFEITESVAMSSVETSIAIAHKLRDLGAQLSIDDFGTGYSSLSYLRHIPLRTLKIDRSFVADMTGSNDASAITRAIIALGNSLKLRIVAEGVETAEQLALLRSQGCDEMQGFLLGRPVPAELITQLLLTSSSA